MYIIGINKVDICITFTLHYYFGYNICSSRFGPLYNHGNKDYNFLSI